MRHSDFGCRPGRFRAGALIAIPAMTLPVCGRADAAWFWPGLDFLQGGREQIALSCRSGAEGRGHRGRQP